MSDCKNKNESGMSFLNIFFFVLATVEAGVITNAIMEKSEEQINLLDRQLPDDIVFDLVGRKTLITRDDETDEYNTFKVYEDGGIPFVIDPWSGRRYVVMFSMTSKEIEIFPVTVSKNKTPVVEDPLSGAIYSVALNKFGEVELVPFGQKGRRRLLSEYKLDALLS